MAGTITAMMRALGTILIALAGMAIVSGCQSTPPVRTPVAADLGVADFDRLWDATLEVLRRYNFQLDRRDRRMGVITTHPITSAQSFEFWRHEVIGSRSQAEADLHTIRRQATIELNPAETKDTVHLAVRVEVFRLSVPERQVTTASSALQVFGSRLPTAEGRIETRQESEHWVDLGRDSQLEAAILRRIAAMAGAELPTGAS